MDIRQKNSLPWGYHVSRGNMFQAHVHHQFGRNVACPTTYVPVTDNGIYRTVQPAQATPLRIKAGGNAADSATGTGARAIRLTGISASGDEISETLATNGASASAATAQSFIRLYHVEVIESGTYGTQAAGSHAGNITIEDAAGTADWAQIQLNGFPSGVTGIGSITIPRNHAAYVNSIQINVDNAKSTDVLILKREGILDTAPPYSAIQKVQEFIGVSRSITAEFEMPLRFTELTDLGVLAKVSNGTGAVSVDIEVIVLAAET
jgi:hypothetical protein